MVLLENKYTIYNIKYDTTIWFIITVFRSYRDKKISYLRKVRRAI